MKCDMSVSSGLHPSTKAISLIVINTVCFSPHVLKMPIFNELYHHMLLDEVHKEDTDGNSKERHRAECGNPK